MNLRLGLTAQATGTADAITATFTPAATLVDRTVLFVTAAAANATTTPTFSPDGATARTITKLGGQALVAGDILGAGHVLLFQYNLPATRWELLNPSKLLTHSTLAQILANDNKTGDIPIISDNGAAEIHAYDIETALVYTFAGGFDTLIQTDDEFTLTRSSGITYSSLHFEDLDLLLSYYSGVKAGYLKIEETQTELFHDDLINFTAPSVMINGNEVATQSFVHAIVQSNIKIIGDWDATSGSMPLDDESNTTPFIAQWGATIKAAWAFRVGYGQAGTVGGYDYEEGDVVYALIDNAGATPADWGDLDHNLQQASESLRGTAKITTNAIIDDETTTDNERIVTPYKLWGRFVTRFLQLAWTWVAKQTFTTAPRFNSTTASQYLKVDASKDLESVSAIPAADITESITKKFVPQSVSANDVLVGDGSGGWIKKSLPELKVILNSGILFKLNTTLTHTGTTTPTVIASFPIPIGFNEANDFWHIWGMCGVDITGGGAGNNQIRMYIGPNPTDIGGATYTASLFVASTLRTYPIARTFVFKNSLTTFEGSALTTDNIQTDYTTFSNAPASVTIDFSTQKYLHILGILANAGNIIKIHSLMSKIER